MGGFESEDGEFTESDGGSETNAASTVQQQ